MAGSQTLRFDIVGDGSSASRAFKDTATNAALAARGAKQLSDSLGIQSKSARVSADATLALAKSDSVLRDAQLTLAGATDDASGSLSTLKLRLDAVNGKVAAARVSLDGDKEAQAQLDAIDARLAGLDHKTSTPALDIQGVAKATAELSAIDVALDKVGGKGGSAQAATSAVGSGGLAGPGGILALVGAGVALAPVLVTTSVGLAGFGAAAAATVAPILAAGTATKAQQDALASLDPAQRAAYTSLGALKTQFGAFSRSLEPEVLGVFGQGLKLAGGLLGDVQPVAAATGKALGVLVGEIGADLKTSQWQNFFGFMAQTAGPDIKLLGNLFVSLMNDLPPLLIELQPLATGFLQVADGAAKAIGVLGAWNPNVNLNAKASDQANQANQGWLGTVEKFVNTGARMASGTLFMADSTKKASGAVDGMGNSAKAAAPQVGTLSGDLAILNSSTRTATDTTKAFDDAWLQFVGKSVSDQQAVLTMAGAFDSYNQTLKTNKQDSTVAQQAFLSIITAMGSGLATLQQNGASVSEINKFYQVNIDRLKALHNLNPAQRADVQNVTRDYDAWATSTGGLNGKLLTAADTVKNRFTANLKSLGEFTPGVTGDIDHLSNSVLKTGTTSAATAGFRAKLIADLKQAGVSGSVAAGYVDGLEGKIAALKGKTVSVGVVGSGSGKITFAEQNIKNAATGFLEFHAAGGPIRGSGGPRQDNIPVMASKGEFMMQASAVDRYGLGFMHAVNSRKLASGGPIDASSVLGAPDWMGGVMASAARSAEGTDAALMVADMRAKIAAAAAAAAAAATAAANAFASSQGASGGIIQSMMRNMAAARGWTGSQWNALAAVENREAGWSMTATNPSSGAYGLAQFINGPSEYAQYGGNSTTAQGQITGMLNYIAQRYGSPQGAWNHEVAYGWYDKGGMLNPGLTLAYNGTGKPEQVIPGGRGGGDVHVHLHNEGVIGSQQELQRWLLESTRELARVKGGGNVQTAFGRA